MHEREQLRELSERCTSENKRERAREIEIEGGPTFLLFPFTISIVTHSFGFCTYSRSGDSLANP